MADDIIFKELGFIINGILFSVHNELGRYCNEKQIGDLIEFKLKEKNLKFEREKISNRSKIDFY